MNNRNGINGMVVSDYFSKGTDFSATDFTKPDFQLWVSKNLPKNKNAKQGFAPWVGQLIHKASYDHPEIGVMKELSLVFNLDLDISVGCSIDRVAYIGVGLWRVEDIKTQGMYPAKSAFKQPKQDWITQLSIYRYALLKHHIDVTHDAVIHQYVMGFQKNKDGMEEYNELNIELMDRDETEDLMKNKIAVAKGSQPVEVDCPKWMCEKYCDWNQSCPHYNKGV